MSRMSTATSVREFLEPIVNTTCQGYYTSALMVAGSMAALTNGAAVKIWSQKPTPLFAPVFQIGNAQAGKSRLFSVCEQIFDACDDVIGDRVDSLLDQGPPVTVKSICLQSFTITEFFYRCSTSFPLVDFAEGDGRVADFKQSDVRCGRAFNLDEAHEFWDGLGLLTAGRGGGDKDRAPVVHASTLNALIGSGQTRRATRTSATFGESRGKRASVSLLGNRRPEKFIAMDRGGVGNHTARTKERFVICIDHSTPRRAALPAASRLPPGVSAWAWLPLTPQQARTFDWETFLDALGAAAQALQRGDGEAGAPPAAPRGCSFAGAPGEYKVEFPDGEESRFRFRYLRATPPSAGDAPVRTEFRISNRGELADPAEHVQAGAKKARKIMAGNQVAQGIRAQLRADDDATISALESNAAGQQGVQAALLAVLDHAVGGGTLDEASGLPIIAADHVQCARRMLDISLAIRDIWRAALDEVGKDDDSEGEGEELQNRLARPVRGQYSADGFGAPLAAQPPVTSGSPPPLVAVRYAADAPPVAGSAAEGPAISQPAAVGAGEGDAFVPAPPDEDAFSSEVQALQFSDLPSEEDFDKEGLGEVGRMLFAKAMFKDRELIRRVLLAGRSRPPVNACVDNCNVAAKDQEGGARRKKRVRPSKPEVVSALKAAFEHFPRLRACRVQEDEVVFVAWPSSARGQTLFHNELMRCCHVLLRQLSQ
ncbi:unnamed protein product, partial [Prorocentrum cordatum]